MTFFMNGPCLDFILLILFQRTNLLYFSDVLMATRGIGVSLKISMEFTIHYGGTLVMESIQVFCEKGPRKFEQKKQDKFSQK